MPFAAAVPYDHTKQCGFPVYDSIDLFEFATDKAVLSYPAFLCPLPQGHSGDHQDRPPYSGQVHPHEFSVYDHDPFVMWNDYQWIPLPKGNVTIEFNFGTRPTITSDQTDDEETGSWD